jgi:ribosomal protein L30E
MLDHLGLARRAGDLILGFDQVERALRSPKGPAVIVEAADGAPDGQRKLQAASRSAGIVPFVIGALTSAELSLALGRSNVVHAALKSGRIAERLVFDAGRLNGFRPLRPWVWAGFSEGEAGKTG